MIHVDLGNFFETFSDTVCVNCAASEGEDQRAAEDVTALDS